MTAAVLFDLDGTLLDPAGAITETMAEAIAAHGMPRPAEDTLRRFVGPPAEVSLREFTDIPEDLHPRIIADYRAAYPERARRLSQVYPGIMELLETLRQTPGVRLAVATQKPQPSAEKILGMFDLLRFFPVVSGARDARSPEHRDLPEDKPGIVAAALERLEETGPLDRSRSVMIGDREYDAAGARSSGLACLGVGWGFGTAVELLGAGAEAVCTDAAELQRRILTRVAGTEPGGTGSVGTGPVGTGLGAGNGAGGVVDEAADGAS